MNSVALRSACADAQADLELHCPHMSETPILYDAAYVGFFRSNTDYLRSIKTWIVQMVRNRYGIIYPNTGNLHG